MNDHGQKMLATALLLALLLAFVWYVTSPPEGEIEESGDSVFGGVGDAVGDAVREAMDIVSPSQYPARWGSGIRKLAPVAQPFFAALYTAMEARGWHPRSRYPHRDIHGVGGPCALDIVDNEWKRNAWQSPEEPYLSFYRDLGAVAQSLGLVWGGTWAKFAGDSSAWAKAWRAATGWGDMIHVEWYPSTGSVVPAVG